MMMERSLQQPDPMTVPQHPMRESPDALGFALRHAPVGRKSLEPNGVSNASLGIHSVNANGGATSRLTLPQTGLGQETPSMTKSLGTTLTPAPARISPAPSGGVSTQVGPMLRSTTSQLTGLSGVAAGASGVPTPLATPTPVPVPAPALISNSTPKKRSSSSVKPTDSSTGDAASSLEKKDVEKWSNTISGGVAKPSRWPTGGREHVCRDCGMRFSHRGHFNQHVRAVHEKIRKHKCTYKGCEKAFAKRGDLMRHQLSQHTDGARFQCTRCGVMFADKGELAMHFADVHDEDKPFKCMHCTKAYSTRSGLRKHINAKHAGVGAGNGNGNGAAPAGAPGGRAGTGASGHPHQPNGGQFIPVAVGGGAGASGGWVGASASAGAASEDTAVK